MDYEKKYNAAFKVAENIHRFSSNIAEIKRMEEIFPELKKSEDEKIIEEIENVLQCCGDGIIPIGIDFSDCFTWLERQRLKMHPKWLYRLEYKDSSCGLWYDGNGKWCFESGIGSIEGCKTKELPMEYDERYKQDGRDWFSSCSQKEDLMHWYSLEDAKKLLSNGFVFTRYLATEYHECDQQTLFIKETALYREEINIFELFGQKTDEWSEEDETVLNNLIYELANDIIVNNRDEYVDWLKSIKDRVQPKQEWSEEDKRKINRIYSILLQAADTHAFSTSCRLIGDKECVELQDFLRTFRPQNRWKPSDEQMEALEHFIIHHNGSTNYAKDLEELRLQLKKLREE